ncbi:MAG: ATP-binding cassette domain-containing protein [Bacteroidetes bacterium]|nr:ATP-binding cassette domain-containing protein [Bacteroidota bacterium]
MKLSGLIELENVSYHHENDLGESKIILDDISLRIEANTIVSVIAPKDAGLSSLMKICANLMEPSSGNYKNHINKEIIFLPTEPSTFPWLNVLDNMNVMFKENNEYLTREVLNQVGLDGYEDQFPLESSYSFRVRLALARSIITNPKLIVVDESFKYLVDEDRFDIYEKLKALQKIHNCSFLIGTRNLSEALLLSNRIILLAKDPCSIIDDFEVNFTQDSCVELVNNEDFLQKRNRIIDSYRYYKNHQMYRFTI